MPQVLGSVGISLPETEIKVVDPDSGEEVLPGVRGLVKVRGPQIMKGYYKVIFKQTAIFEKLNILLYMVLVRNTSCLCAQDPEATTEVVDMGGWFDTGDLGWIAPYWETGSARSCGGVIVLDGRAKDTIVLSNGWLNITNISNFMSPLLNAMISTCLISIKFEPKLQMVLTLLFGLSKFRKICN